MPQLHQISFFGKHEIEEAARHLVRFFCETDDVWKKFTLNDIVKYCAEKNIPSGAPLFGLIGAWFNDGMFGGPCNPADPPMVVQVDALHFAITSAFLDKLMEHV